jgi:PAS domain-containing protein
MTLRAGSGNQNSRLQIALELNQRAQQEQLQHLERVRAQQDLILLLTRQRYSQQLAAGSRRADHRSACDIYESTAPACGTWKALLVPISAYHRTSGEYLLPEPIDASRFPTTLKPCKPAAPSTHNAMRDPRTREMAESLRPRTSTPCSTPAFASTARWSACCAWSRPATRAWQSDEIAFAGELADQFAQVINNHNRRTATSALHLFQRAVEQSANAFLLVNRDGVVEYVNPSFTAITQYSTEEVQAAPVELPALENLSELLFDAPQPGQEATAGRASSRAGARTSNPTGASCRSPRCTATTAS